MGRLAARSLFQGKNNTQKSGPIGVWQVPDALFAFRQQGTQGAAERREPPRQVRDPFVHGDLNPLAVKRTAGNLSFRSAPGPFRGPCFSAAQDHWHHHFSRGLASDRSEPDRIIRVTPQRTGTISPIFSCNGGPRYFGTNIILDESSLST